MSSRRWPMWKARLHQSENPFGGKLGLPGENLLHPGLHAKKYDASRDIWQGRVNRDWRFYIKIIDGTIIITKVMAHPK